MQGWTPRQWKKFFKLRRSQDRRGLAGVRHYITQDGVLGLRFDTKNPRPKDVVQRENDEANAELLRLYPEIYDV